MTGRPRDFDESAVLESAMQEFWSRGYEATSYRHLVEATGLGRQSLYQAFGDKRQLFEKSIQHYAESITATSIETLTEVGSPKGNIQSWLNRLCEK